MTRIERIITDFYLQIVGGLPKLTEFINSMFICVFNLRHLRSISYAERCFSKFGI